MDVTPQLIEQIDFSEKFRGYDPDQVDDFLERVGATIAELNNAVRDANIRAERAELMARNAETAAREAQAAAPPAQVTAPMTDEEAATTAARTLMLAQRTADDLLAGATADAERLRSEAQLVHEAADREARAEADRVLADARASAEGLLAQARRDAEAELVTRRDEIAGEISALDQRRAALLGDVTTIEARMDGYRASLDRVHGAIRNVLDDPNALRALPPLDLADAPAAPGASFVEATAQEWGTASAGNTDEGGDSFGSEPAVEAAGPVGFGSFDAGAVSDAFTEVQAFPDAGITTSEPSAVAEEVADSAFSAWNEPVVEVAAEWVPEPTGAFQAVDFEPASTESVVEEPWAPGSWSTMVGESATTPASAMAWDESGLSSASGAVPVAEYVPLLAEPTMDDTFGVPQSDRFMRDLDEAVNQPQTAEVDQAMTAFFEGDDEPATSSRRFRRR